MSNHVNTVFFLDSNKGNQQLVHDGHIYRRNKQTNLKIYWTCKTKSCVASVHTDTNSNFLQSNGEHNHLLEPEDIELLRFRSVLKARVVNETAPISKIYDEELAKARFSPEVLASVPMIRNIRKCLFEGTESVTFFSSEPGLNQARRKLTPTLPDCSSFDIPDCYQNTITNEKFFICDKMVCRKKRMLIFASSKHLDLLFNSPVLFMDGTFSAIPPFFDQIFTIHALKFECGMFHVHLTSSRTRFRIFRSSVRFCSLS